MDQKLVTLGLLLLAAPVFASKLTDLANKNDVINHFSQDIIHSSNLTIDTNKIVIISANLNGDEMKDFWVLYPDTQCTSQECWGHVYLKTANGYCFAGRGMSETDLNYGRKTTFKCKSKDK